MAVRSVKSCKLGNLGKHIGRSRNEWTRPRKLMNLNFLKGLARNVKNTIFLFLRQKWGLPVQVPAYASCSGNYAMSVCSERGPPEKNGNLLSSSSLEKVACPLFPIYAADTGNYAMSVCSERAPPGKSGNSLSSSLPEKVACPLFSFKIPNWLKVAGLALGITGAAYAANKFNLIQDGGFEQPKPNPWTEKTTESYANVKSDSYNNGGYNSKHSGLTKANGSASNNSSGAILCQEINYRKIQEIDSLKFYIKHIEETGINYFGVNILSENDTLTYMFKGIGTTNSPIPKETEHRKIVELDEGTPNEWHFYQEKVGGNDGDWTNKGLPTTTTIKNIEFMAYYARGPPYSYGEQVQWDSTALWSTRFDHDLAVIKAGQQGQVPNATVANAGANTEAFMTVYDIFNGNTKVYSDTTTIAGLASDSSQNINFKPYAGQGNRTLVRVISPTDENPDNDSLSGIWTGIEEKVNAPERVFKVGPDLTRGQVQYTSSTPVEVYNSAGSKVNELPKGQGTFVLKASGVYFARSGDKVEKIVKVK